jgi:hypothetical protein
MSDRYSRRRFLARARAAAGAAAAWSFCAPAILRAADDSWGDLQGRFVYDGPAPQRMRLKVDKDVQCCGKFDIRDESLMVGLDGGLANVFVYLRSRNVPICPELEKNAPKRVTLDNRDCIFQPHCLTIWVAKQEFYMINSDPVAQNIAFNPPGDVPANIVLAVGKDATYQFSRAQILPVPIACNYHPWESGYVLPRNNPYMSISSKDGTFRITKLPLGKLEFQAWDERVGFLETPDWPKGRFSCDIKPGANDLGTIKLGPARLEKA